jgi:hypothetical protein
MLFVQTSAPVGWTKSTTHDNKALRVVSGTAGSGGTVAFTTAFASKSVAGTVGATTLTAAQMPSHTHGVSVNSATATQSANHGHTGSTDAQGAHAHNYSFELFGNGQDEARSSPSASDNLVTGRFFGAATDVQGSHNHFVSTGVENALHQHSYSFSVTSGAAGSSGSHTHSFTGTAIDLAVQYVDVIIATKN